MQCQNRECGAVSESSLLMTEREKERTAESEKGRGRGHFCNRGRDKINYVCTDNQSQLCFVDDTDTDAMDTSKDN